MIRNAIEHDGRPDAVIAENAIGPDFIPGHIRARLARGLERLWEASSRENLRLDEVLRTDRDLIATMLGIGDLVEGHGVRVVPRDDTKAVRVTLAVEEVIARGGIPDEKVQEIRVAIEGAMRR